MRLPFRKLATATIVKSLEDLIHEATTLNELTHSTPRESYAGKECSVKFVAMNKNGGLFHVTYRVTGRQSYSSEKGHLVKFRFFPDPKVTEALDLDIEVSCECAAFVYNGAQHNVKQRDALEREIKGEDGLVNLSAPDLEKYPHHNYVICKHIYYASQHVGAMLQRHMKKHKEDTEFSEKQYQKSLKRVQNKPEPAVAVEPDLEQVV